MAQITITIPEQGASAMSDAALLQMAVNCRRIDAIKKGLDEEIKSRMANKGIETLIAGGVVASTKSVVPNTLNQKEAVRLLEAAGIEVPRNKEPQTRLYLK